MTAPIAAPAVSVLMPVYNGQEHLRGAIDSVLAQTFGDFECIIVDDHSTDSTRAIAESYRDPRIRTLINGGEKGISPALNLGLDAARGSLVARMDCDDLCLPQRLEKQVRFMEGRPEIGICGTFQEIFGGYCDGPNTTDVSHDQIKASLLFTPTMFHSTVVMRAGLIREHGLFYRDDYRYCEDHDLWVRAARVTRLANIPEFLCRYRWTEGKTWETDEVSLMAGLRRIWSSQLEELDWAPSAADLGRHAIATGRGAAPGRSGLKEVREHLQRIMALNRGSKVFDEASLRRAVHRAWRGVCGRSRKGSPSLLPTYAASRLLPSALWVL